MSLLLGITPIKQLGNTNPVASLPGLVRWLKANNPASLTLTGSTVNQWDSTSPATGSYVQDFTGLPSFDSPSGIDAVVFDTSDNEILGSGSTVLQTSTDGFLCLAVVTMTSGSNLPLFGAVTNDQSSQLLGFGGCTDGFSSFYGNLIMSCSADGLSEFGFYALTPNGFSTDLDGVRVLISYRYNGSGWSNSNSGGFGIALNGTDLSLTAAAGVGTITGDSTIGGWGSNGNRLVGSVHEFIYCNKTVSDAQRTAAEAALKTQWGL